jgi:hypothetical protein
VVFEVLTKPHRPGGREWLHLLNDEQEPTVPDAQEPDSVVVVALARTGPMRASSSASIETDRRAETTLCWTLMVEVPGPDTRLTGHRRKRMNELINGNLRYSFGP